MYDSYVGGDFINVLIELYSKHNINNVLACDVFRPAKVIFICSNETPITQSTRDGISDFLKRRNQKVDVLFENVDRYDTQDSIFKLHELVNKYPDCTIDITGGSDNMLFAVGVVCSNQPVEVITYSYKNNRFFNIQNAEYVEGIRCQYLYTIKDFIEISGGKLSEGRIRQDSLTEHMDYIEPLFRIFMKNRNKWFNIVSWIYHACGEGSLFAKNVPLTQRNIRGKPVKCPVDCLRALAKAGLILDLEITDTVSFSILDEQVKFWLTDNGSALEVYTYKRAVDSGIFNDVACSVIIEWNSGTEQSDIISNEIDVMGVCELTPYFISCKACKIDTYALNELDIIRKRFGGPGATAFIVSSESCSNLTRIRAKELNIEVIDYNLLVKDLNSKQ